MSVLTLSRKCKFDRGYVWTIKGSAQTQVQVENTSWCLNAGTSESPTACASVLG
jgi:hypothetical protein